LCLWLEEWSSGAHPAIGAKSENGTSMRLEPGGIDVYYVDESMDPSAFVIVGVAIPFLRNIEGTWTVVWEDHFDNVRDWRRRALRRDQLPVRRELKGSRLASGRGHYKAGKHQYTRAEAADVYRRLLGDLDFLQDLSIITVVGSPASNLYGHSRLEALVLALLQRMRTACSKTQRLGLVFFDEGHGEVPQALQEGPRVLANWIRHGGWAGGAMSKNLLSAISPRTPISNNRSTRPLRSSPM